MKHSSIAILLTSMALVPFVHAQVPAPAEIEGTLNSITPGTNSVELRVMDVRVLVPATAVISTPTRDDLTLAELSSPVPFPGRSDFAGFLGGTAIVIGTVDATGLLTAESVFVEPAENVVLGVATPAVTTPTPDPAGTLRANGMLVKFLTDDRIKFDKPLNDLGFEIGLPAIVPGSGLAIEGYYSAQENTFFAFALEATNVPALNPALQVSILRAQGRADRGELDVRGGVSGVVGTGPLTVQIHRVRADGTAGARIGNPVTAVAGELPGTFTYRFTARGITPFPQRVIARVARNNQIVFSQPVTVEQL